ncbi:hypothetical protein [Knoellia subterranea]|uniref:DUF4386 family protein n=1 Tax=Knoellia subterranea KCTC 19937 TaxID=1385521 RepID=A0A0A0JKV4_9MICO|nr:hypothetical protein [Knoellia subterranea]KGN37748.1 hypothetical protein N803_11870 [Knoellia subterranea KCTC 19937]
MSTTLSTQPTTPAVSRPPRDLRRTTRILAAVAIVLGPVLVTVLRAILPYWTNEDPATSIEKIAASPGAISAVNWISVISYPFLLAGALAVGYAARRRTPLLALVSSLVLFGGLGLASMVGGSDLVAEVMTRGGYDNAVTADVTLRYMEHPAGLFGLLGFVLGHIVGMILVGITAVRARLVPVWVGAAIIVAQPVHVIASVIVPNRALDVVAGWGLTAVGFAFIALAVLRMDDDEWDAPPAVSPR